MGLFKRKDPDFIDLPGDQIGVSADKAEEMADQAMERIADLYGGGVPAEIEQAITGAVEKRHPEISAKSGSLLASTVKMGYGARLFEEGFESIPPEVPMLTQDLQGRIDQGEP